MKNRKWSLCILALMICILTACGTRTPASKTELNGNLLEYDLGESTLHLDQENRDIPYQIQGVLGIPDKKNCPVVILVHGAHPIENAAEDRYDIGFNYLAQSLSEQGNLVISMNVGMNFSFENGEPIGNERSIKIMTQQLLLLKEAVEGNKKIFNYDLSDVGDFDEVVVMGHSRSGLDVLEWATEDIEDVEISGIVSLAPSYYEVWDSPVPDVPIGIIIPQMDGDVISLDGNEIYEEIVSNRQYSNTIELIYLKNANHGHFNTQLTQPDLNHNDMDVEKLMSAEKQRKFLEEYLIDFVKKVTTEEETVFASESELKSNIYQCDVLLRVHNGEDNILYSAQNDDTISYGDNISVKKEIASYFPEQNTVGTFNMPGGAFENYALDHIVWSGSDSYIRIPVTQDIADYRFLDIDMAVDSSDLRNKNGQSMIIRFTDMDGSSHDYPVNSSEAALMWQEGELNEVKGWDDETYQEYSTFTPLVTLRIDLNQIKEIDLSRLEGLDFLFNGSTDGSIMLRSITVTD